MDLRTWGSVRGTWTMSSFDTQYVCRGYNYLFPRVELRWVLKRCLVVCSSTEFVENSIHSNCWSSFAINWQWALWSMFTSHRWKVPPVSTFFLLFKNMITIIKKTWSCCCRIRDCQENSYSEVTRPIQWIIILIIIIFKLILIYFCQCWPGPLFFDNVTCYSNLMPFHYTKWLPRECANSVLQCTIPVWNGLLHNWYQHSPLVKEVSKDQWNSLGGML